MPKIKKEFDQVKYQNEYKKRTYDRMELLVPKGEKAIIKERAAAAGQSVNEFVYSAVKDKMVAMILDGYKDLEEAKAKVAELLEKEKPAE